MKSSLPLNQRCRKNKFYMALLTLKFVTNVRDDQYEVVEFHGELDQSTLSSTEKQMGEFLEPFKRSVLIFDLSDLKFINSEGIGFLVAIHAKLRKKGQDLFLCGFKKNVADVMNVIGLPSLIPVFQSVPAAIERMKQK